MPGDDAILWFGVMVFSTLVGFLIAWPVNGLLVRKNVKPGGAL
jgi:peptidoglycan/LPS O-acetylase OafA/YrhL